MAGGGGGGGFFLAQGPGGGGGGWGALLLLLPPGPAGGAAPPPPPALLPPPPQPPAPPWCSRVDRPASRALDDHDLADAVGPRPRSTGDQGRRDKKSDHEQQGQNPKSESHPISLKCEDPFLDS